MIPLEEVFGCVYSLLDALVLAFKFVAVVVVRGDFSVL